MLFVPDFSMLSSDTEALLFAMYKGIIRVHFSSNIPIPSRTRCPVLNTKGLEILGAGTVCYKSACISSIATLTMNMYTSPQKN